MEIKREDRVIILSTLTRELYYFLAGVGSYEDNDCVWEISHLFDFDLVVERTQSIIEGVG